MQYKAVLALLLAAPVSGNECSPGYTHKKDLAGLMCMSSATDPAHCNSECCERSDLTCGGLMEKAAFTCPSNKYAAGTAAWKNRAATDKNKLEVCCDAKAKCSAATCAAYQTKTAANAEVLCPGDAASCALSQVCCADKPNTCGTQAKTMSCGKVTAGFKKKANDGSADWQKVAGVTDQNKFDELCCDKNTCGANPTCPAGSKAKTAAGTKDATCTSGAASNDPKDCEAAAGACCELNADTCGGQALACPAGTYKDNSLHGVACTGDCKKDPKTAADSTYKATCCSAVATCAAATCKAGEKKKAGVEKLACTGNSKSCTECCEADNQKCGSQTGISCPYGSFDESTMWTKDTTEAVKDAWKNKAGNSTTKNTACCTARTNCVAWTTTPAPGVVTTTPAAPALKYSQHKVMVGQHSQTSSGANMVWLGAGAVVGMGVLMAVQGLRSKTQPSQVDSDDDEALLGTAE